VSEANPLKLLPGDNPQISKGDGDGPVKAYIQPSQMRCHRLEACAPSAVPAAQSQVEREPRLDMLYYGRSSV
jgi:hypothetical protein